MVQLVDERARSVRIKCFGDLAPLDIFMFSGKMYMKMPGSGGLLIDPNKSISFDTVGFASSAHVEKLNAVITITIKD